MTPKELQDKIRIGFQSLNIAIFFLILNNEEQSHS